MHLIMLRVMLISVLTFFKVFTEYTPEDFDWVQTVNGWKWQKNTVNYDEVKDLLHEG